MPNPPELRVCGIRTPTSVRYHLGRWRRRGKLFVPADPGIVIEERELPGLIRGIRDAFKTTRVMTGSEGA